MSRGSSWPGALLAVLAACTGAAVDPALAPGEPGGVPPTARSVPPAPVTPRGPTYHADVAPIVGPRCGGCHRRGGIAPFALETAGDAIAHASSIALAVESRVMPPWPADDRACATLRGSRRLTPGEIAVLVRWAEAGAPEGDASSALPVPPPPRETLEDGTVLVPAAPYRVEPGDDEYRCFLLDPGLAADGYLTAFEVLLDRGDVVHHVQLFALDDAAVEAEVEARERADAAPGYRCDQEGLAGARYVGVWAPGDRVRRLPAGTGILLRGGHRMILQLHYHPAATAVADRSGVRLAVEAAVEHVVQIGGVQRYLFTLPPREPAVEVDARLIHDRAPALIHGVRLHMHRLGRSARLELARPSGEVCLLDIPQWQFDWQLFYDLDEPIALDPGDVLRVSCVFDTTSRVEPVGWGTGTDDEMCIGYVLTSDR